MPGILSLKFADSVRALAVICLLSPALLPAQLTPAQTAGKQIYTEGTSPSGRELGAILGEGSTRVPATLMLCANCHGSDGKGRPEGGVNPSEITWDKLMAPLRSTSAIGRRRPAYNSVTLGRAIVHGTDPAGHSLGATMPRYRLSPRDLSNLIQYLKVLGRELVPGVTDTTIRLGTIVPASGPLAVPGRNSVALLRAYFEELNKQGGIYGRRLELVALETSGTPEEIEHKAEEFVRGQNIFALLGILAPGAEPRLAGLLERMGVPTIAAFASSSEKDAASRTRSFYLLSGLSQQAEVLVKFARDRMETNAAKAAIVYPESMAEVAGLVMEQCHTLSFAGPIALEYSQFSAAAISESLSRQKVEVVFFLGHGKELESLLANAAKLDWHPTVFQPGPLAGQDVLGIAAVFDEKVFLSFPTLLSDLDPGAMGEYRALAVNYKLSTAQPALLLAALASAKVMLEGIRMSGRQLDRDKFITTLSSMYGFNTGLTPPVTYGATRRIGALGAYIVKLDLKNKTLAPVGSWMTP
jgi:ABC-type branched-subunit amino acid transport system substrate-binding protein